MGIYTLNEDGQLTLKKDTEILTMYLPETDIAKIKQGVEIIGDMELNSFLSDFE